MRSNHIYCLVRKNDYKKPEQSKFTRAKKSVIFLPSRTERNPLSKLPWRQASLANLMAHLHSLSTTELLARLTICQAYLLIKSNLLKPSPELNNPKGLVHPLPHPESSVTPFGTLAVARYEKVANCVHPVMDHPGLNNIESFTTFHPLLSSSLPLLLKHPPDFTPSEQFTKERMEKMDINPSGFLLPEEHKLVLFLIKEQEAFNGMGSEWMGKLQEGLFRAHCHPTVKHISWVWMKCSYTTRDILMRS